MANRTTATETPRLTKLKQKARSLGLPYTTMRDAAMRHELAFLRIGRALYVENAAVERWIASCQERATKE